MRAEADVVEHSLRKDRLLIVHHLFPVFFRASDPSSASASGASNQSPFGGRDEGASARSPPSRRPSDPKSSGEMAATRHPASSALTRVAPIFREDVLKRTPLLDDRLVEIGENLMPDRLMDKTRSATVEAANSAR
jgi:hypothetical protein